MPRSHSWWLSACVSLFVVFFFHDTPPTEIYTLSLHDALPIWLAIALKDPVTNLAGWIFIVWRRPFEVSDRVRSEEHTSELQSHSDLVCRLLLEKKKEQKVNTKLFIRC